MGDSPVTCQSSARVLRANPQIPKLAIPIANETELLDTKILPLLVSSFTALTSLNLVWRGLSIPESSIEMIGSLTSLEQIHLSAGDQHGWRHNWLIDHELMRQHLGKLPNLKRIAFSRDSYNFDSLSQWEVECYYQPGHRSEARVRRWEQTHRKRITAQIVL